MTGHVPERPALISAAAVAANCRRFRLPENKRPGGTAALRGRRIRRTDESGRTEARPRGFGPNAATAAPDGDPSEKRRRRLALRVRRRIRAVATRRDGRPGAEVAEPPNCRGWPPGVADRRRSGTIPRTIRRTNDALRDGSPWSPTEPTCPAPHARCPIWAVLSTECDTPYAVCRDSRAMESRPYPMASAARWGALPLMRSGPYGRIS